MIFLIITFFIIIIINKIKKVKHIKKIIIYLEKDAWYNEHERKLFGAQGGKGHMRRWLKFILLTLAVTFLMAFCGCATDRGETPPQEVPGQNEEETPQENVYTVTIDGKVLYVVEGELVPKPSDPDRE